MSWLMISGRKNLRRELKMSKPTKAEKNILNQLINLARFFSVLEENNISTMSITIPAKNEDITQVFTGKSVAKIKKSLLLSGIKDDEHQALKAELLSEFKQKPDPIVQPTTSPKKRAGKTISAGYFFCR